jgi:hypothetical protein
MSNIENIRINRVLAGTVFVPVQSVACETIWKNRTIVHLSHVHIDFAQMRFDAAMSNICLNTFTCATQIYRVSNIVGGGNMRILSVLLVFRLMLRKMRVEMLCKCIARNK